MKKLLSLLSVLTISGTAIPTTIAASPYQKETQNINDKINFSQENNLETLNRNKRDYNNKNKIEVIAVWFGSNKWSLSFVPNFWEEIIYLYNKNDINDFSNKFKDKCFNENIYIGIVPAMGINQRESIGNDLKRIGEDIYNNFDKINLAWKDNSKHNSIKIVLDMIYRTHISTNIENDYEKNKYLENLLIDFNGDLSKKVIDLGIIEDKTDNFILNKIKEKYPKLDISYFEIFEKKDYSFFDKSFSTKFKIKSNKELLYPIQTLNNKFTFITNKWLNEDLPKLIDNENLIKNWNSNFNEWKNEINRQKTEDLPKYGNDERGQALKRTWKGNHLSELKNKLLSLNHILETIDNKFKINELYKTVQGLQKDIDDLKQQISQLNQKIDNIKTDLEGNKNLETCTKTGALISATTGWIPTIGTLVSTISGTVSAICDIANT
ncbi:alpha-helical pore-forming toxin family protein [Spiroplasma poulsonii]|uniref:alpha-helical pore-forming toxin family protein n=1 Tax=Spiroplasma poulsonii TaxID=2138 RepID=UPI001F4CAC09|nr:alpha-helical pore-forming toxin family protein [Spiroplasma poulsonii]UNF62127.1 alpha-helical pore-forming toxin family protein [Spiroplasma poulsonii]